MTEAEYEYECSRAELLGLPKPTWEEFSSRQREKTSNELEEEEECGDEMTAEQIEDAGVRKEGLRRIGGGLDELNSILASTQKKINRFKSVCGSFSNILKLQADAKKDEERKSNSQVSFEDQSDAQASNPGAEASEERQTDSPRRQVKEKTNSGLDKLDSLISKAERAELSLSRQNKQMKKFLN